MVDIELRRQAGSAVVADSAEDGSWHLGRGAVYWDGSGRLAVIKDGQVVSIESFEPDRPSSIEIAVAEAIRILAVD